MTRYIAVIDFSDGLYGVSFPDAPGCVAMGATQDEAVDNAAEALSEWVADELAEGRAIPRPRDIEALRAEMQSILQQGGLLASVPLILETGKLARANISLDAGLLADIDQEAHRRGVTRSAFLAAAARDKIKASA